MFRRNNSLFEENKTLKKNFLINRNKEKKKFLIDFYSNLNFQNDQDLFHFTDCLKEILNNKLSLHTFSQWFSTLVELLNKKNIKVNDYLNNIYFLKNDENLSTEFFKYCYKLFNTKKYINDINFSKYCNMAELIFNTNILGNICFITPDIDIGSNHNKIGAIIQELGKGLNKLGQNIIIICPYYHCNKNKNSYINNIQKIFQISINLDVKYIFDIYYGENNDIKYYFIYNPNLFKYPHPTLNGTETIREISCFSKGSLELLLNLNIIPEIIITNDAYTGFTSAYAKNNSFNNYFNNTIFIHLLNNIDNQGRIYLPLEEGSYENIHKLPNELVTDSRESRLVNPISCALRMCDQWATLSKEYKNNLLKNSKLLNLFSLLNDKKNPIFISSGITKEQKLEITMKGGDKEDAKRYIQKNYFCYKIYNPKIPLYSFIGNLKEECGALLLLDFVEKLCKETNNKINILIIGNGDINDPYYQICLKKINYLKINFPYCIYVEPNRNFSNDEIYFFLKGSDFGIIPYLYYNWTNLHIKYFVAEAPIIGYGIGNLKDDVKEFNFSNGTGNGFLFDHYNSTEFFLAIKRSLDLFKNEKLFEICRINCEESVLEFDEVSLEFCKELYELKHKIFFKSKDIYYDNNRYNEKCSNNYNKNGGIYKSSKKNKSKCKEVLYDSNHFIPDYTEFGNNVKRVSSCKNCIRNINKKNFSINNDLYIISYKLDYPQPKRVQITGSYDNWTSLKDLKYNNKTKKWEIELKLKKGKYYYKYLVDNKCWKINPFEHYQKELNGIVNNVLYII